MSGRCIWVVAPFSNPAEAESADRYRFICQELTARGAKVVQFISSFDHATKRHRVAPSLAWRCVAVSEPGYRRNVSLARLASHAWFDLAILFYLLREGLLHGRPDTLLVALPHNGAGCVAGLFCRLVHARLIIDVHDTWPESILGVARLSPLKRPFYQAWRALADCAIGMADQVFAESVAYAERANGVRRRRGQALALPIYLGGDLAYYEGIAPAAELPAALEGVGFLVTYAGTLGMNYDLDCVLDAFAAFASAVPEAGLLFLGGGEREEAMRAGIEALGLKGWVSGRLPHRELLGLLKRSKVGLNAFKAGGNVAYSYKLNDYLLAGVPVVNSLEGETGPMLAANELGFSYAAGDPASLLLALRECQARWLGDPAWGTRILAFSARHLDRREAYRPLLEGCLY